MTSSRSEQPGNGGECACSGSAAYNIQRLVARGGMGERTCSRSDLDREVAIKVMSEEIMRDEQARARFYREAKAAARLQHRNIVTVFDFAHDGEIPYFVMEFLRGQNLSQRLRQGPPLTLARKLDLAVELCEDFISHTVKA